MTKEWKAKLQAKADSVYCDAAQLAKNHGLELFRHMPTHYSLANKRAGWRVHFWPTTQKMLLKNPRDKTVAAPYRDLPSLWTPLDVVCAYCGVKDQPSADYFQMFSA
jgi:hypothetical protein